VSFLFLTLSLFCVVMLLHFFFFAFSHPFQPSLLPLRGFAQGQLGSPLLLPLLPLLEAWLRASILLNSFDIYLSFFDSLIPYAPYTNCLLFSYPCDRVLSFYFSSFGSLGLHLHLNLVVI
jgi:hypothetical protein